MSNQPGPLPKSPSDPFDLSTHQSALVQRSQQPRLWSKLHWEEVDLDQDLVVSQIQGDLTEIMMNNPNPNNARIIGAIPQNYDIYVQLYWIWSPQNWSKLLIQWPLIKRKFRAASRWHCGEAPGPLVKKRRDIAKAGSFHRLLGWDWINTWNQRISISTMHVCVLQGGPLRFYDCYN